MFIVFGGEKRMLEEAGKAMAALWIS